MYERKKKLYADIAFGLLTCAVCLFRTGSVREICTMHLICSVCCWLTGCLSLHWLSQHFPFRPAVCGTLVLILTASLIYRAMPLISLPFMIGLLIGADQWANSPSRRNMFLCSAGIALSSFCFIPGTCLVLSIYVLSLHSSRKKRLKDFSDMIRPVLAGIPACMLLLLSFRILIPDLFIPQSVSCTALYTVFTLSSLWMICVMMGSGNRRTARIAKAMALCCVLPVLICLFRGTLCTIGTALLPFAPLSAYLSSAFVYDLMHHRIGAVSCLKGTVRLSLLCLLLREENIVIVTAVSALCFCLPSAAKQGIRALLHRRPPHQISSEPL